MDDPSLKRLDRVLAYQATTLKAEDWEEFYVLDVRFHTMLFERLGMRRVANVIESARAPLERARRLLLPSPGRSQNTLREHRAIFAALSACDPTAAASAMGAHLDEAMAELKRFAARQPPPFDP